MTNKEIAKGLANDPKAKSEWEKLKNGEIKDPAKLVEIEMKMSEKIHQKEAQTKIDHLTSQVEQIRKSGKKGSLEKLKKELLEFISSSNIYYSAHRQAAENLLTQLENYSTTNPNQNNSPTPSSLAAWKIIIPILLVGVVLLVVGMMVLRAKRIARRLKKM